MDAVTGWPGHDADASILALIGFLGSLSFARAKRSPFLNLDAGACDKLEDKNLQVGPPDADIVAACAALHRGAVLGGILRRTGRNWRWLARADANLRRDRRSPALRRRPLGRATGARPRSALEGRWLLRLRGCVGLVILAILRVPMRSREDAS